MKDHETEAVLFDFSGTLFRIEPVLDWYRAEAPAGLTEEQLAVTARALAEAGAQPGGPQPLLPPPGWETRDDSAELHRRLYTAQARAVLGDDDLADRLYRRHRQPAAWRSYPDTAAVLKQLRARGIPVALVSNIGWDPRPVLAAHGVDDLVDAYVLSYRLGVSKPEPEIFRAACRAVGADPARTLMVGDDLTADGGARSLGCSFLHVRADREEGLLEGVLAHVGG
ncbi:HAD family hydrolase [Streptacidiphilus monticola]|jgi:putative hydrolase of the HAD superfamily|uniref:HAD family hydrolase n=1 Tax=Streptacidiphilus monticola TaxID=2161674 RepID=A0ABW1GB12_9ACTN